MTVLPNVCIATGLYIPLYSRGSIHHCILRISGSQDLRISGVQDLRCSGSQVFRISGLGYLRYRISQVYVITRPRLIEARYKVQLQVNEERADNVCARGY